MGWLLITRTSYQEQARMLLRAHGNETPSDQEIARTAERLRRHAHIVRPMLIVLALWAILAGAYGIYRLL